MDNSKTQIVGDQQALKNEPRTAEPMRPVDNGQLQIVGDKLPLKMSPTPDQFMNKHVSGGEMQIVGDKVPLSKTPSRGWNSHPTPMNTRTDFLDKI